MLYLVCDAGRLVEIRAFYFVGCDSGRFGEMCEFECHCKDEKSCGRLGTCSSGCHPGWMNTTCQTSKTTQQILHSA